MDIASTNNSLKGISLTKLLGSAIDGETDLDSFLQRMMVSNGMRLKYPNLWEDSSSPKNMTFDFKFTSPYGDPLSIFHHVYVPFLSLLTFAMPRQASDNGLVSPFFVRASIPGLINSDMGIISDLTWVRGGNDQIFTKDGLPREISGSFTIEDLFPYLSMTKRVSFLSANPSYTVFLDNMAGVRAHTRGIGSTLIDGYWNQMLNKISGDGNLSSSTWNLYGSDKRRTLSNHYRDTNQPRRIVGKSMNPRTTP